MATYNGSYTGQHIAFDDRELQAYIKQLMQTGEQDFTKELKRFLSKEAAKQARVVKRIAKNRIDEHTGNYKSGLKSGRTHYSKRYSTYFARAYAGRPAYHAGLVEFGHKKVNSGVVYGRNIFHSAHDEFQDTFDNDAFNWMNDLLTRKLR